MLKSAFGTTESGKIIEHVQHIPMRPPVPHSAGTDEAHMAHLGWHKRHRGWTSDDHMDAHDQIREASMREKDSSYQHYLTRFADLHEDAAQRGGIQGGRGTAMTYGTVADISPHGKQQALPLAEFGHARTAPERPKAKRDEYAVRIGALIGGKLGSGQPA